MADDEALARQRRRAIEPGARVLACALGELGAAFHVRQVRAVIREPRTRLPAASGGAHEWLIRFRGHVLRARDLPALCGTISQGERRRMGVVAHIGAGLECLIVENVYGIFTVSGTPSNDDEAGFSMVDLVPEHGAPGTPLAVIDSLFIERLANAHRAVPGAGRNPSSPIVESGHHVELQ